MYKGPVIDLDIHHDVPNATALLPYMSQGWREYVDAPGRKTSYGSGTASGTMPVAPGLIWPSPIGIMRAEAFPENGDAAGSSYELMCEQLLDPYRIRRGVLCYASGSLVGGVQNPYLAAELARASNDWTIAEWLEKDGDERLFGSVLVSSQMPDEAAREVRRVGAHPRMAQVLLVSNGLGRPFGHPVFHPIYEAAIEAGIPVAIHVGGDQAAGVPTAHAAGGQPSLYLEAHVLNMQAMMTHLVSFLCHGVFEKFRELRLLLIEGGITWVPAVLWRLDSDWKAVRREAPFLRRHPSEYFAEHVRVTTQPIELAPRSDLINVLEACNGADVLCFSSDYPHWDTDDIGYVSSRIPPAWHERVFWRNAIDFYGWHDLLAREDLREGAAAQ